MSQLILMVARVDDLDNPDVLTEVWRQTMPVVNPADIAPHVTWTGWRTR
jgi:hypothetical protein